MTPPSASYSDGHPLDQIRYREYKILLKPERFFSPERIEEYWNTVSAIAKNCGVKVRPNENAFHRLVREVLFYDTPEYDLYRNSFILRTRTFYDNGWPQRDHELTIKFRHPGRDTAAAVDVRPRLEGTTRIKFKEEILPLKIEIGGMRSLFSHNCVHISPLVILEQGFKDITQVFPALANIKTTDDSQISLVNNSFVEEVEVEPGFFDFGHGLEAKATIALWRNRATEQSLIGEFGFQAKFHRFEELHRKALERSEEFYKAVQTHAPEWVELGTTKTAIVYGLGSKPVVHNE